MILVQFTSKDIILMMCRVNISNNYSSRTLEQRVEVARVMSSTVIGSMTHGILYMRHDVTYTEGVTTRSDADPSQESLSLSLRLTHQPIVDENLGYAVYIMEGQN